MDVRQSDTLNRDGKGSKTVRTGMTWSGFRPSDDACLYGYLVPANMFAVVVLGYASEICREVLKDESLAKQCEQLASEIKAGIEEYAVLEHPIYGDLYVYQDAFLTSSEANVRNMLYGLQAAKEYGVVSKVGYFPDTFGIYGQAPQLLQQANIKTAAFGRGVKPTGFNNMVSDAKTFESPYSELKWKSPDLED